jgi:hypothetical protein
MASTTASVSFGSPKLSIHPEATGPGSDPGVTQAGGRAGIADSF